jgi:hypothetical protein
MLHGSIAYGWQHCAPVPSMLSCAALLPACLRETMLETRKSFFLELGRWLVEGTWHSLVIYLLPM